MTPSSGGTLSFSPVYPLRSEFHPDFNPRDVSRRLLQYFDPNISPFHLSESQRLNIEERCGREFLPALRSLSLERDSRIFFASLQRLSQGLEEQNRLEPALVLDTLLRQSLSGPSDLGAFRESDIANALRGIASESGERGAAILGRGRVLPRLEFLARRLVASSLDLPSLLAMGTASLAGRG